MPCEAITDDFDDPPTFDHPEDVIRASIADMEQGSDLFRAQISNPVHRRASAIYGVGEEEWSSEWQEGERVCLR
jgi:hypothetical protein